MIEIIDLNYLHAIAPEFIFLSWKDDDATDPCLLIDILDFQTSKRKKPSKATENIIKLRNEHFRALLLDFYRKSIDSGSDPIEKLNQCAQNSYLVLIAAKPCLKSEIIPFAVERPKCLVQLLNQLKLQPFYQNQLQDTFISQEQLPQFSPLKSRFSVNLFNALKDDGCFNELYSHQSKAIDALTDGKHVIISTSTSSGKSLVYQMAILNSLYDEPKSRAFLLFPTKALAQDQKRAFQKIVKLEMLNWVNMETFDGDTELNLRSQIRKCSHIIFTNPDMIHSNILPNHSSWKEFFTNLKFVVVDELHYYNGEFGSHCAMIMRRLLRVCKFYGNQNIQFIASSATISNPQRHMEIFFNIENPVVIDIDTSLISKRIHAIWNPPFKNSSNPCDGRINYLDESCKLIHFLMQNCVRTICFVKSRKECEIVLKKVQFILNDELADRINTYRGGYSPEDRRMIESQLFKGELLCVICTNALELGVDIGSLDCVLHLGFPQNMASFKQQAGRVGRRHQDCLSILIADGDKPLDQYYVKNPSEVFGNSFEKIILDLENKVLLEMHLQCAASEIPIIMERDFIYFGNRTQVKEICDNNLMFDSKFSVYFSHSKFNGQPSAQVKIRCKNEEHYKVIDINTRNEIESIEESRVPLTLYIGAILMYQRNSYVIMDINTNQRYARALLTNALYFTSPQQIVDLEIIKSINSSDIGEFNINFGKLKSIFIQKYLTKVSTAISGYKKCDLKTNAVIESVSYTEIKTYTKTGVGIWFEIPEIAIIKLQELGLDVPSSIHSVSHSLISLFPTLILIPEKNSIRTNCKTVLALAHR